ncbi:terpene cyclase/mutase family protein [Candidatus Peregrinibacteria bacterium]|nr:terpene cyclase/mutase family protein [Candidatus Peregrinibacteria bacterium]
MMVIALGGEYIFSQELKSGEELAKSSLPKLPVVEVSGAELAQPMRAAASFIESTSATEKAIKDGLAWLAANQNPDGSWGKDYPVAITSLAGLAFMAGGNLPDRGEYKDNVRRALEYITSQQGASGFVNEGNGKKMHSHGYATLFLAELYGMVSRDSASTIDLDDLKWRLKKAVNIIESCQHSSGGWFYYPAPSGDENSVTITVVQALRAARNAGIKVNSDVVNRAVAYVKNCSNSDGGIAYSLSDRTSTFAITAAGVSVLNYLGEYKGEEVQAGLAYLKRAYEDPTPSGKDGYDYYEDFYAALAFWNSGSEDWVLYFPRIRDELLSEQKPGNFWESPYGDDYATALSTLILQIPYRLLPIFQR